MRNKPHGPLNLLKFGTLPTLALIAATIAPPAHAQIRNRIPSVLPTPTATPAARPNPRSIRRLPATETPTPSPEQSPVSVQSAEATPPQDTESSPVRSRRDTIGIRTRRDPGPTESMPSESVPVRTRRMPIEATPPPRDSTPVRVRRAPTEDTSSTPEPTGTTPVRTRRVPVEATPPVWRDPTPVRVRNVPAQDMPPPEEPMETTPVRPRRGPVEVAPPIRRVPTPVQSRYAPNDEAAPFDSSPPRRVMPWSRTDSPARATPGEDDQPAPARRAPGRSTFDGATPSRLPGPGVGRTISSAQTDCLFRPNKNPVKPAQSASSESVNILAMVCRVNGQAALMSFRYDRPADKSAPDARFLAAKNHEAGATSLIDYEITPIQTDAAGRPIYQLLSVSRGEQSRKTTRCIIPDTTPKSSPNEDDAGSVLQRWCGDGTTVSPLSIRWNAWLKPVMNRTVSISTGGSTDGYAYYERILEYDDAIAADANGSGLLRTTASVSARVSTCKLPSNDATRLDCTTDPIDGVVTTYRAYSLPELRPQIGPLGDPKCTSVTMPVFDDDRVNRDGSSDQQIKFIRYYNYKTTTCETPRIAYVLFPGQVAPQYRSQVNGACRLASFVGIATENVVQITFSRAVEATNTGEQMLIPDPKHPGEWQTADEIKEGKTIAVNGTIDPDTKLGYDGTRVPKENITKVNAPCS